MRQQINKIVHKNKNKDHVTCIKTEKGIISDPFAIGNEFNEFYTSVSSKLVSIIKTKYFFHKFLDPKQPDSMFLQPTNNSEIEKIIKSLGSNKSSDIYGMSPKLLKILFPAISETLSNIFNESFALGIFPDHMKLTMITPIFKGGSKFDISNYRPVSVLSIISKVLEKLMLARLIKYLGKSKKIYEHQFRFQKNRSTTLAVLDLSTRITNALDSGNYAASVFLDFAKAFDTINHQILLRKLENYSIRGPAKDWFESYLRNRHQIVKIGDTLSDEMQIVCGVPQGSILGPILFLLYISDIKNSSKMLKFFLYTDDTNTLLISKSIQELECIYNKELSYVTDWLNANKLTLNVEKSNLVLFRSTKKQWIP